MSKRFDVFLSFEGVNREKIILIKEQLEDNNIQCLYDKDQSASLWGNDVDIMLNELIEQSNCFVPFLTENYHENFWTKKEIKYARSIPNDNFIAPIIIGTTDKNSIDEILIKNGIPKITGYHPCLQLNENEINNIVSLIKEKVEKFHKLEKLKDEKGEKYIGEDVKYNYELREPNYYKTLSKNIKYYYQKEPVESPVFFERTGLFLKLKDKIKKKGIVFIEGSLLTGKTLLLNHFSKWIERSSDNDIFIKSLSDDKMIYNRDSPINSIEDLYQIWGKSILMHLVNKGILNMAKFEAESIDLFHLPEIFKKKLHANFKYKSTFLEAMLEIILSFLNECGYEVGNLYLVIHLDDFQKYVDGKIFGLLKDDLNPIISDKCFESKLLKKINIIISTRLFHKSRPSELVININNYAKEEIKAYLEKYIEKLDNNCYVKLIDLITEYTSGHPWFVSRFVNIYLILRLTNRESNPLQLSEHILNTSHYWLRDKIFDSDSDSLFNRKLIEVINRDEKSYIEIIRNFLEEKEYDYDIFNSSPYNNNPKLKETGLIQISLNEDQQEDVNGYGNKILELFFHNEILNV